MKDDFAKLCTIASQAGVSIYYLKSKVGKDIWEIKQDRISWNVTKTLFNCKQQVQLGLQQSSTKDEQVWTKYKSSCLYLSHGHHLFHHCIRHHNYCRSLRSLEGGKQTVTVQISGL